MIFQEIFEEQIKIFEKSGIYKNCTPKSGKLLELSTVNTLPKLNTVIVEN